jgi:hypothetical protein
MLVQNVKLETTTDLLNFLCVDQKVFFYQFLNCVVVIFALTWIDIKQSKDVLSLLGIRYANPVELFNFLIIQVLLSKQLSLPSFQVELPANVVIDVRECLKVLLLINWHHL